MSAGLGRSINSRAVGRIAEDAEIKPHRVKMWCHSDDLAYQQKKRAIDELYINLPKGEPVLNIDEKSEMQILSRCCPLRSAASRRGMKRRPIRFGEHMKAFLLCD